MKSFIAIISLLFSSCTNDKAPDSDTGYTPVVVVYDGYEKEFQYFFDSLRISRGLEPMKPEKRLTNLALKHAKYMNAINEINHDYFYSRVIESQAVRFGECCAYNFLNAASEISAYENSPSHLNVLISPVYKYFGVAKVDNYQCVEFATWKYPANKLSTETVVFKETKDTVNGKIITQIQIFNP